MKKILLALAVITATIVINANAQAPTATIGGTYSVCAGNTISIAVHLTNGPIWDVTFKDTFGNKFTVKGITTEIFYLDVTPIFNQTYSIASVSNRTTPPVGGDGIATVVVNERPLEFPLVCDFPFICQGRTSGDIVLPCSEADVTYQLFLYGELYPENEVMGNGSSISFPGRTKPGLYYILAKKKNGCPAVLGTITLEMLF